MPVPRANIDAFLLLLSQHDPRPVPLSDTQVHIQYGLLPGAVASLGRALAIHRAKRTARLRRGAEAAALHSRWRTGSETLLDTSIRTGQPPVLVARVLLELHEGADKPLIGAMLRTPALIQDPRLRDRSENPPGPLRYPSRNPLHNFEITKHAFEELHKHHFSV